MTKGILLVNLGTPDSPKPRAVWRYLNEFLTDRRVIDFPWLKRQLLVRGIISPFRHRASARSYQELWTENGSPLLVWGEKLKGSLQEALGPTYQVELGMRYQNPSIRHALDKLHNVSSLNILPLFPQYASATTGSVFEKVMEEIKGRWEFPQLHFINHFYDHPLYIQAVADTTAGFDLSSYDQILFSFHGLPQRQLKKGNRHCLSHPACCQTIDPQNQQCYSAQCYATANAVAQKLNISHPTVCFQSRLGRDPWLQPYTADILTQAAKKGHKRLLVFSPSFVSDCLETTIEIGTEYRDDFLALGGHTLDLVPSLNLQPAWIDCLSHVGSGLTFGHSTINN